MKKDTLTGLMPLVNLKLVKRKLCMKVRSTQLYNNDSTSHSTQPQDVALLDKLDKKLRFIDPRHESCSKHCFTGEDPMGAVAVTEQAIVNEAQTWHESPHRFKRDPTPCHLQVLMWHRSVCINGLVHGLEQFLYPALFLH